MALLLLLLGACTGPVRSTSVYESKAGATAETVASAVETARLAVQAAQAGDAYGRYLTLLLAGWLFHDGRYVEWGRIRTIEPDRILISGTVEDLPRPGPSS
jgi:hypothetical protein